MSVLNLVLMYGKPPESLIVCSKHPPHSLPNSGLIANDTLLGVDLGPPTSSRRLAEGAGAGAASMSHVCEVFGPGSGRTCMPARSITH